MNWTVGRRIGVGFSIVLGLLVVCIGLGVWVLRSVTDTYESAITQRRTDLVPALRAESELRRANISYLRFMLETNEQQIHERDSTDALAASLIKQLQDSADTDTERTAWAQAAVLQTRWRRATDSSIAAKRAGNMPEALRIRAEVSQPIRTQLDSIFHAGVARATRRRFERRRTVNFSIASAGSAWS